MTRVESYFFEGEDHKAEFKKHTTLPFGVYVPLFMKQKNLLDGVEWGYGNPSNSFTMTDSKLIKPDYQDTDPVLAVYEEYLGSDLSLPDIHLDYFLIRDEQNEMLIKLRYTEAVKEEIRPLFLSMIGSLKYIHSREQFESGVFMTYDEELFDETEKKILQVVSNNLEAILKKDSKLFARSMESSEIAEALKFLINDGRLFRFNELKYITAIDEDRVNVGVRYQMLSEEGFLAESGYTFTLRKNKSGVWKIANID